MGAQDKNKNKNKNKNKKSRTFSCAASNKKSLQKLEGVIHPQVRSAAKPLQSTR
jgi:hypothetical protein